MPRNKSPLESAAGKLISAIQKEWGKETGEPQSDISEDIMNKAHILLQNSKTNEVLRVLHGMSVTQFLGTVWVYKHPDIKQSIVNFEMALKETKNV